MDSPPIFDPVCILINDISNHTLTRPGFRFVYFCDMNQTKCCFPSNIASFLAISCIFSQTKQQLILLSLYLILIHVSEELYHLDFFCLLRSAFCLGWSTVRTGNSVLKRQFLSTGFTPCKCGCDAPFR